MPLLGPALVLYLLADVAASRGSFELSDYALAAVVVALSCSVGRRPGPAASGGETHTAALQRWLSLCVSVALLQLLRGPQQRLSVEMAETAALAALGGCVLELAWTLPDTLGPARWRQLAEPGNYACAALCALVSCVALGPEFHAFGRLWLLPAWYAYAAAGYACFGVTCAIGLRLLRRRRQLTRGSAQANSLALAGSWPVLPLAAALWLGREYVPAGALRGFSALVAIALCLGHRQLLASQQPLTLSNRLRDGLAVGASIGLVSLAVAAYPFAWPTAPVARGACFVGTLLCALALYGLLGRSFRRVLAPDSGRLLEALAHTNLIITRAQTLQALVESVLLGLRRAQPSAAGKPLVYGFDPAFEGHSDAAGAAHLEPRAPHPQILARLRERPRELLIRSELEQQIVRQPAIRPLLDALVELDLLCVVPLSIEGELEGAVFLPRGSRSAPLSQEEQRALWDVASHLAGMLAVFSAQARAEQRANTGSAAAQRAAAEVVQLTAAVERLTKERALLHDQRAQHAEAAQLVAYSAAARVLVTRLRQLAQEPAPVLLIAEPGLALEPLARVLHRAGPFVTLDCAALRVDQAEAVLFGGEGEVGCLRIAEQGSLLLLDLPALPLTVQAKLAWALANQRVLAVGATESYALGARLIVSTRQPLDVLTTSGRLSAELTHHLSPAVCRVPPLRECPEDVSSLLLLATDRACRRQGREPLGIEPEAMAALLAYEYPGNHLELEQMIDRAAMHARGTRLTLADFAVARVLPDQSQRDLLSLPLEALERKVLLNALSRARGNKAEAARLLGLPRSTLLDKLRRHKLEESHKTSQRPN